MIKVTVLKKVTMTDRVLIVDFGSQVTQLIARRVRESGVYCEIHPCTKVDAAFIARFAPRAVILSGGPASVTETHTPRAHPALLRSGPPGSRHLLRAADDGRTTGWPGRARRHPRVRPRRRRGDRRLCAVRRRVG